MSSTTQSALNFVRKIILIKSQNPSFQLCVCGHPKSVHDIDGRLGGKGCTSVGEDGVCDCNWYRKKE